MIQDYLIEAFLAAKKEDNHLVQQTIYRLLTNLTGQLPDELITNYKPMKKTRKTK